MSVQNLHDTMLMNAQFRAVALTQGEPYASLPTSYLVAALAKHGGLYTLLDQDLMTARMAAFIEQKPGSESGKPCLDNVRAKAMIAKLQSVATNFFYKLVNDKPGYTIHSELMAYISEPGKGNGVTYDEGVDPSPTVPAAFTFVGQFIDHDLTFNGMNLTADEHGVVVVDEASPVIDLDSVYGPRLNVSKADSTFYDQVFNDKGKFILNEVTDPQGHYGWDVPRNTGVCEDDPNFEMAYIFDPRNDENQLILQIHILLQRLHNKLIDKKFCEEEAGPSSDPRHIKKLIECVRKEVVATWQSFVRYEYMPAIILNEVLDKVIEQIKIKADPNDPKKQYGDLRHKPYRDLVNGKNVVRMPHEFAIGFRFGHSQLRPMYLLNNRKEGGTVVLLFKDARISSTVTVMPTPNGPIVVDGSDDLRGHRKLTPNHVIDWNVFYPVTADDRTKSLLIDSKVTARVFNLPESAIPDDIKYIGNLPHRNLIRSSQIGIVSGEELADFYDIRRVSPEKILGDDHDSAAAKSLFESDRDEKGNKVFKTPLWYYLLKEAETSASNGAQLGPLGSRLVAEVLAGALYYGNEFVFNEQWVSRISGSNKVTLRQIIDFVNEP